MSAGEGEKRPHINADGEFQSDKYPSCPAGKVPLSTKDPAAQDLLWIYAQRRREVDKEFADDLESALKAKGYASPIDAEAFGTQLFYDCAHADGVKEASEEISRLTASLAEARERLARYEEWPADREGDRPIAEDAEIEAAFPTRSKSYATYDEAMRMVGAKRSKGALVALVNWLLITRAAALAAKGAT